MSDLSLILVAKAIGASIGSAIAVVFRPGGDKGLKLFQRFVIGTILGFISAPIFIDLFGWPHTFDYWLAAATGSGLLGYMTLQALFSREAKALLKQKIGAK